VKKTRGQKSRVRLPLKTHFRIGRHENKEKNTFSTLVLELFSPSIASCRKLKIQKNPKIDFPYCTYKKRIKQLFAKIN
jgi:hypothetical protein